MDRIECHHVARKLNCFQIVQGRPTRNGNIETLLIHLVLNRQRYPLVFYDIRKRYTTLQTISIFVVIKVPSLPPRAVTGKTRGRITCPHVITRVVSPPRPIRRGVSSSKLLCQ